VQVLPVADEVDDEAEDEHADRDFFHASHQTTSTLDFREKKPFSIISCKKITGPNHFLN
jgi:hypothetical protein